MNKIALPRSNKSETVSSPNIGFRPYVRTIHDKETKSLFAALSFQAVLQLEIV